MQPDEYVQYRGMHLIDKGVIEEYEFLVPYAEDPSGVITYYTRSVAKAGWSRPALWRLRHARADGPRLPQGRACSSSPSSWTTRLSCAGWQRTMPKRSLRTHSARRSVRWRSSSASQRSPRTPSGVSQTPPFPWSRQTVEGKHTVFNLTPVDNALEGRFAQFLDRATDVAAWAKLTMNSRFALEYISKAGALRYYYPDFVVRLTDDSCLIIETKGQEDLDVALKDRRARRWCEDATRLAGREWAYEKVGQRRVRRLHRRGSRRSATLHRSRHEEQDIAMSARVPSQASGKIDPSHGADQTHDHQPPTPRSTSSRGRATSSGKTSASPRSTRSGHARRGYLVFATDPSMASTRAELPAGLCDRGTDAQPGDGEDPAAGRRAPAARVPDHRASTGTSSQTPAGWPEATGSTTATRCSQLDIAPRAPRLMGAVRSTFQKTNWNNGDALGPGSPPAWNWPSRSAS